MLLASWNLQLGLQLDRILQELSSLPCPDLLAVQEASIHGGRQDSDAIAKQLGPSFQAMQVTAQQLRGRIQANGLVWDTRCFRFENLEAVALPVPSGRLMGALPASQRNFVVAEGALTTGASIRVHVVHLDVLGVAHKRAQFRAVIHDAGRRQPVDLAVIAGDLNTFGLGPRPAWNSLDSIASGAGFEDVTGGIGWTQRAFGVRQKLDAIFMSPAGLARRAWAEPVGASDHLPVFVETEMR